MTQTNTVPETSSMWKTTQASQASQTCQSAKTIVVSQTNTDSVMKSVNCVTVTKGDAMNIVTLKTAVIVDINGWLEGGGFAVVSCRFTEWVEANFDDPDKMMMEKGKEKTCQIRWPGKLALSEKIGRLWK